MLQGETRGPGHNGTNLLPYLKKAHFLVLQHATKFDKSNPQQRSQLWKSYCKYVHNWPSDNTFCTPEIVDKQDFVHRVRWFFGFMLERCRTDAERKENVYQNATVFAWDAIMEQKADEFFSIGVFILV
jgi:hypothetical protein